AAIQRALDQLGLIRERAPAKRLRPLSKEAVGRRADLLAERIRAESSVARDQMRRARERRLELADVPRPVVREKAVERVARDRAHVESVAAPHAREKVRRQERNVVPSLPKGRRVET